MNENLDYVRFEKLKKERLLQIKRQGAQVVYCYGKMPHPSFFTIESADVPKLYQMINQTKVNKVFKLHLQVCSLDGTPIITFKPDRLLLLSQDLNKVYIQEKREFRVLTDGQSYYIAKRNPSNSVYKSVYSTHRENFSKASHAFSSHLKDYIDGKINELAPAEKIPFIYQSDLNTQQNKAIQTVCNHPLTFIKGPPGCGKTKTIARIIKIFAQEGKCALVGTVSNIGNASIMNELINEVADINNHQLIELMMKKMVQQNLQIEQMLLSNKDAAPLKLMYYIPLQSKAQNISLDPLLRYYSFYQYIIRNMLELDVFKSLSISQIEYNMDLMAKSQQISNRFYSLYMQASAKTIKQSHIIVSTTVSSAKMHNRIQKCDQFYPHIAIIDQASQASWHDTFLFLKFNVDRLVLVGDENQLDPTVISQDKLLKQTVFGKLSQKNKNYYVLLDTQYRMHPQIAAFPNSYFYNNQLKNGVTVEQRTSNIPFFKAYPISFIAHNLFEEEFIDSDDKRNYYNLGEVTIICHLIAQIPKEDLHNVGIITPYNLQLQALQQYLKDQINFYGLTIKTCDGYQGGQKDYIIISCVRSNLAGKIGFCGERNRANVSLTRAKKGLAIVGNAHTLSAGVEYQANKNVWAPLITYLSTKNYLIFYQQVLVSTNNHEQMQQKPLPIDSQNNSKEKSTQANSKKQEARGKRPDKRLLHNQEKEEQKMNNGVEIQQPSDYLTKIAVSKMQDKDECEQLMFKNKQIAKIVRKSSPFQKKPQYNPKDVLNELHSIFKQVSVTPSQIGKRITLTIKEELKSAINSNTTAQQIEQSLLQLLTLINPQTYSSNHLKQSENICQIIKLELIYRVLKHLNRK